MGSPVGKENHRDEAFAFKLVTAGQGPKMRMIT